jgi:thiamine kinase-like enzyme
VVKAPKVSTNTDPRFFKWKEVLRQSGLLMDDNATFTLLSNTTTHPVYTFCIDAIQYVIKQFEEDPFTQLDRKAIFDLQKQLFRIGIAPEPICYHSEKRIWVERFVQSASNTAFSNQYVSLGKALAAIHALHIDDSTVPRLHLPAQWQRYLKYVKVSTRHHWQTEVEKATQTYYKYFEQQGNVLCHNDLSLGHILNVNPTIVVDWEYAAMGSGSFDIASAIAINNIDEQGEEAVCKAYADASGFALADVFNSAKAMKICTKVTNGLWYEAKSALPL